MIRTTPRARDLRCLPRAEPGWLLVAAALAAACASEEPAGRGFDDGLGGGDGANGGARTTAGGGGSTTSASTGGSTTGSGGDACPSIGPEPNDTQADATDLGAIDDCDGTQLSVQGALADDDEDWYVFHGIDDLGCVVDPTATIVADGAHALCVYAACEAGPGTVTCPDGAMPATSEAADGCCGQQSLATTIDCPGFTDSATVYIQVRKPPAEACVVYTLTGHY